MEDKIKIEPKSVRGSSANFINVLGVAMSALAILAIIFTLVMTQISLNEIALSLDAIEEKLEVAEEDIEEIREVDVDAEEDESTIGAGASVYNEGDQRVDFDVYSVWVPEEWTLEELGSLGDGATSTRHTVFSEGNEQVFTLSCPTLGFGFEGMTLAEELERKISETGTTQVIARFTRYVRESDEGDNLYMISIHEVT